MINYYNIYHISFILLLVDPSRSNNAGSIGIEIGISRNIINIPTGAIKRKRRAIIEHLLHIRTIFRVELTAVKVGQHLAPIEHTAHIGGRLPKALREGDRLQRRTLTEHPAHIVSRLPKALR